MSVNLTWQVGVDAKLVRVEDSAWSGGGSADRFDLVCCTLAGVPSTTWPPRWIRPRMGKHPFQAGFMVEKTSS